MSNEQTITGVNQGEIQDLKTDIHNLTNYLTTIHPANLVYKIVSDQLQEMKDNLIELEGDNESKKQ